MPDAGPDSILIQLVYATKERVWRHDMRVPKGCTAGQAVDASPFAAQFPSYPHHALDMGIFGQTCARNSILANGDRVEIYRPLSFDPMESRRRRAAHRPIGRSAKPMATEENQ